MRQALPLTDVDGPEFVRVRPRSELRPYVVDYVGYRETTQTLGARRELPVGFVPVIANFGAPWEIGSPSGTGEFGSFVAGLSTSPTSVRALGEACCLQINFTPLGASRFFRMPAGELTDRVVDPEDLLGPRWRPLRARLFDLPTWPARFSLVENVILDRIGSARVSFDAVAWGAEQLRSRAGLCRIEELARQAGWSRRHFSARFRREVGLGPKTFARVLRFNHALALAQRRREPDWAGLAAEAGYADQPHMIREFVAFSGFTPAELVKLSPVRNGYEEIAA